MDLWKKNYEEISLEISFLQVQKMEYFFNEFMYWSY
jgi:hypothetical protein